MVTLVQTTYSTCWEKGLTKENAFIASHTHFWFLPRKRYCTVGMGVRRFMAVCVCVCVCVCVMSAHYPSSDPNTIFAKVQTHTLHTPPLTTPPPSPHTHPSLTTHTHTLSTPPPSPHTHTHHHCVVAPSSGCLQDGSTRTTPAPLGPGDDSPTRQQL